MLHTVQRTQASQRMATEARVTLASTKRRVAPDQVPASHLRPPGSTTITTGTLASPPAKKSKKAAPSGPAANTRKGKKKELPNEETDDLDPQKLLSDLLELGFKREKAIKGLAQTSGGGLEEAVTWLLEQADTSGTTATATTAAETLVPGHSAIKVRKIKGRGKKGPEAVGGLKGEEALEVVEGTTARVLTKAEVQAMGALKDVDLDGLSTEQLNVLVQLTDVLKVKVAEAEAAVRKADKPLSLETCLDWLAKLERGEVSLDVKEANGGGKGKSPAPESVSTLLKVPSRSGAGLLAGLGSYMCKIGRGLASPPAGAPQPDDLKRLELTQRLVEMGYSFDVASRASKQSFSLEACVDWIISTDGGGGQDGDLHRVVCSLERQALESGTDEIVRYRIASTRRVDLSDPLEIHYRIVEAQIRRLSVTLIKSYKSLEVEFVCNPKLIRAFQATEEEMRAKYGVDSAESRYILGFHGSTVASVESIIKNNFSMARARSFGAYGKG